MKLTFSLLVVFSFLLLVMVACSTSAVPTPIASITQVLPTSAAPTRTLTLQPSTETMTSTTGEMTTATQAGSTELPPTEVETPWPTIAPQPAAQAQLPSGSFVQLDQIHMVTLQNGWGISGRYLLKTADGGQTWREVTPLVDQADKAYGVFLDGQTAWILFSNAGLIIKPLKIYHTGDGGKTWTSNPGPPIYPNVTGETTWAEFAILDANNLWVMVRGVYVGAGTHYNHELFHTADGGLTWTSLDGEISDDYTGMVFASPDFGLRTLQTVGNYGPGAPAYDITTDGGAIWANRVLPPPPDMPDLFNQYPYCETYQPVLLSEQSIHILVACFGYKSPPEKFTSYLYNSQDGGATWNTVLLPQKVLASLDTLFSFDPNQFLLLGRDMFRSADAGQIWSYIQTVNWDAQFSFVDPQHGWATGGAQGDKALVNTIDGGKNWFLVKPTIVR